VLKSKLKEECLPGEARGRERRKKEPTARERKGAGSPMEIT